MPAQRWLSVRLIFLSLVALITFAPVGPVAADHESGNHGIAAADMDLSVDPAVDFYRFANGGWLDRTEIPPDFAGIETLSDLEGRTRLLLVQLLMERAARGEAQPGSDEWKLLRLFEQGLDLGTRNEQSVAPIRPILDEIDAIDDLTGLHRFLQGSVYKSVPGFFFVSGGPDLRDSSRTVAYLQGPALSLPSRDYYLEVSATTTATQDAYVAASAELLVLTGWEENAARAAARAVLDFERALAATTLTMAEARDPSQIYNPRTVEELRAAYPLLDWDAYLQTLELRDVSQLIVAEWRYLDELDQIVRATPLPVLKDYLRLQLLWSASAHLSESMEEAAFAYHGAALLGLQEIAPIEGRTLDYVNRLMGDAVGRLYVEAYFSPEAKAQSAELMQELVFAFYQRLTANSWMTESTKAKALEKLAKLRIKVGYPEQWTDYAAVEIDDSYFGSALSAFNALYRRGLAEIGTPVDKSAWPFPPQTVNAMYNALNNEIIVPAAVLQPPFFDVEADPASNFGAIGFVIGHEITHGFDTTGALFDGDGNFANWWSANDYDQFLDLNDRVAAQYSEIEVAPGRFVDGELTLAENVADLGGIQVAFAALSNELARDGRPTRDASGLTQEQRFFIAAATVWRAEIRDEALLTQLTVDPHAPSSVRGLQPLRNCDAFFAAFAIEPGDPMFLPEDERIVIW